MEKAIKQRLLGGLVLVAGAALFLPILLDGAGSQLVVPPMPAAPRVPPVEAIAPQLEKPAQAVNQAVDAAHPVPPDTAPAAALAPASVPPTAQDVSPDPAAVPAKAPEKPAAPAPAAKAAPAKAVVAAPKKAAEPVRPAVEPGTRVAAELPQAWVVQVASLSSHEKADVLLQKLRKKGFHALMHQQGGEWKVVVGPELRKELAESAKQRLAADPDLRLSGWLQPYKP